MPLTSEVERVEKVDEKTLTFLLPPVGGDRFREVHTPPNIVYTAHISVDSSGYEYQCMH